MRRRRGAGAGDREGFSLLELLAVLFIVGIVAALAAPRLPAALDGARLRAGASELRSAFALARALAASGVRVRAVTVDAASGTYEVEGETGVRRLPDGVRVAAATAGGEPAGAAFRVRFFPDGTSDGARVALSVPGAGTYRVAVDPLTGIAEASP